MLKKEGYCVIRKYIVIGLILIFFVTNIQAVISSDESIITTNSNKTLFVDDDGTAEYKKIQDAIDNSSDGDTVFVYSGTYNENIIVNKSIDLKGENKHSAVINPKVKTAVNIKVDNVSISDFKIILKNPLEVNIDVKSDNTNISNNIIEGVIFLLSSNNNTISDNQIKNGGISLFDSSFNNITRNVVSNFRYKGINIDQYSYYNIVSYNTIKFCTIGINLYNMNNEIYCNNFFFNVLHGRIWYRDGNSGSWYNNYWGRSRFIPKIIFGFGLVDHGSPYCFDFDIHPAKLPNKTG